MFRPQIKKTRTLLFIALINVLLVVISYNSSNSIKTLAHQLKIDATDKVLESYKALNAHSNFAYKDDEDLVSKLSDFYDSGLIGIRTSPITTKEEVGAQNMRNSKIACTHPNFSAGIVEELYTLFEGNVENKNVAIGMTGSFPGANIAVLAACESMGINTVIISSVGSSSWGANRENMSWPEIEDYLYDKNIFDSKSIAYSFGGENDLGDNLENEGKDKIGKIIFNSEVPLINANSLEKSVDERMKYFCEGLGNTWDENLNKCNYENKRYDAYINIGGGVASIGQGARSNEPGIVGPIDYSFSNQLTVQIPEEDYNNSVAQKFLLDEVPLYNIRKINEIASDWNIYPPEASLADQVKKGTLFNIYDQFNSIVIIISFILSFLIITVIGIYSHLQIKKRMQTNV